jgi:hypothetical protein
MAMNKRQERKRVAQRKWLSNRYYANNLCHYCRLPTYLYDGPLQATVDHKIPKAEKRFNHPLNYLLCCRTCNQAKGCMSYEDFVAFRRDSRCPPNGGDSLSGSVHGQRGPQGIAKPGDQP